MHIYEVMDRDEDAQDKFDKMNFRVDFYTFYTKHCKALQKMKREDVFELGKRHRILPVDEEPKRMNVQRDIAWYEALLDMEEMLNSHLMKISQEMGNMRAGNKKRKL